MKNCENKYCSCLLYTANALSRTISKLADEEFSKAGLQSFSYAFLLMTVNNYPGIQAKDLAEKLELTQSTITRLIEKMEYKNLLRREHCGRITKVYPTPECKKMESKIIKSWENLHNKIDELLGKDESAKLATTIFTAYSKLK